MQVACWSRDYHAAVADSLSAVMLFGERAGSGGLIVGQNDAAPYNAAWDDQGQLVNFFD